MPTGKVKKVVWLSQQSSQAVQNPSRNESCLEVCPVDCIEVRTIDRGVVKVKQTASDCL